MLTAQLYQYDNADSMVGGGGIMAGTIVGIVSLVAIIVVAFVVNIKMNK